MTQKTWGIRGHNRHEYSRRISTITNSGDRGLSTTGGILGNDRENDKIEWHSREEVNNYITMC